MALRSWAAGRAAPLAAARGRGGARGGDGGDGLETGAAVGEADGGGRLQCIPLIHQWLYHHSSKTPWQCPSLGGFAGQLAHPGRCRGGLRQGQALGRAAGPAAAGGNAALADAGGQRGGGRVPGIQAPSWQGIALLALFFLPARPSMFFLFIAVVGCFAWARKYG